MSTLKKTTKFLCLLITAMACLCMACKGDTDPVTYTVSFETNGGSSVQAVVVNAGQSFTEPAAPTKDGYTFDGWYTDSAFTAKYDFSSAVNSSFTLYAKWEKVEEPVKYVTVTFDANGGTNAPAAQKFEESGIPTQPKDAPSFAGYVFKGWYTVKENQTYSNKWVFGTTITEDITLYAKWAKLFTVTFDANGGSPAPAAQSIEEGSYASTPTAPQRSGYVFKGWYTVKENQTAETEYKFPAVTASITVYAKWNPTATLTFDANGGSNAPTAITVEVGTAVAQPAQIPAREGYIFHGWYTVRDNPTNANLYYFGDALTTSTTLYAQWALPSNRVEVVFETNGGTAVATQSLEMGKKVTAPETNPTKAGYTFLAWCSDEALTTAFDFDKSVIANTKIYALWAREGATTPTPVVSITNYDLPVTITRSSNGRLSFSTGKYCNFYLDDISVNSGSYTWDFDPNNYASGVYNIYITMRESSGNKKFSYSAIITVN